MRSPTPTPARWSSRVVPLCRSFESSAVSRRISTCWSSATTPRTALPSKHLSRWSKPRRRGRQAAQLTLETEGSQGVSTAAPTSPHRWHTLAARYASRDARRRASSPVNRPTRAGDPGSSRDQRGARRGSAPTLVLDHAALVVPFGTVLDPRPTVAHLTTPTEFRVERFEVPRLDLPYRLVAERWADVQTLTWNELPRRRICDMSSFRLAIRVTITHAAVIPAVIDRPRTTSGLR